MSNMGLDVEYGKVSSILIGIIFSNNRFTKEISTSMAKLEGLRVFDLSKIICKIMSLHL